MPPNWRSPTDKSWQGRPSPSLGHFSVAQPGSLPADTQLSPFCPLCQPWPPCLPEMDVLSLLWPAQVSIRAGLLEPVLAPGRGPWSPASPTWAARPQPGPPHLRVTLSVPAELEKQKGVVRTSMSQCSSLKKEPGNGTLSRACLDDSYAGGEGLKRSALSSSLRDLSEAGKSTAGAASSACMQEGPRPGGWLGTELSSHLRPQERASQEGEESRVTCGYKGALHSRGPPLSLPSSGAFILLLGF